ncbi:MAG: YncE family protein [Vampirovibrionales bacterium]|nr:YncE family protein [Vampirovibrionales bacterium]
MVRFFSLLLASLLLLAPASAYATELPRGLISYLAGVDPKVSVRFDGMITFSNGERYIPVLPAPDALTAEVDTAPRPLRLDPANAMTPLKPPFPDIIAFDNNAFLLRLVPKPGGKLSLPERESYPIALKSGLLPQDLILPAGLNIPAELKVTLGTLEPPPLADAPAPLNSGNAPASPMAFSLASLMPRRQLFLTDLNTQSLEALQPETGQLAWQLPLGCLPSGLAAPPDASMVFVSCLNTDEVLVVDPAAQLIKARVPVGARPDAMLWLPGTFALKSALTVAPQPAAVDELTGEPIVARKPDSVLGWLKRLFVTPRPKLPSANTANAANTAQTPAADANPQLIVSNRHSAQLSVIDAVTLAPLANVPLPKGQGSSILTWVPDLKKVFVADHSLGKIYELSLETWRISRILPGLQSMSAVLWRNTPDEPEGVLWVSSRASHEVQAVSVATGKVLQTLAVGQKPTDMAFGADGKLYVLASQAGLVDVIDAASLPNASLQAPIAFEAGLFPSRVTLSADKRYGYIGVLNADEDANGQLAVLDMQTAKLSQSLKLGVKKPLTLLWVESQ